MEWEPGKPQHMGVFASSWMKAFPLRAFSDPQYTLIIPRHSSTHSRTQAELWKGGDLALTTL